MNSQEIDAQITEKDNFILKQMDVLDTLQATKHNKEIELMNLSESIRQAKKLMSKTRLEKEKLERDKWVALKMESGRF